MSYKFGYFQMLPLEYSAVKPIHLMWHQMTTLKFEPSNSKVI